MSLLLDDDEMERKCEHACIVVAVSVELFLQNQMLYFIIVCK